MTQSRADTIEAVAATATDESTGRLAAAYGRAAGCARRMIIDPVKAGARRVSPLADKAVKSAAGAARHGKELAVSAGSATRSAIGKGTETGHRYVRKVPGVVYVEDRVGAALKGIPDRLGLVRADDLAGLHQSIDTLNRKIDTLIGKKAD